MSESEMKGKHTPRCPKCGSDLLFTILGKPIVFCNGCLGFGIVTLEGQEVKHFAQFFPREQLVAALRAMRKSIVGLVWEPLGGIGDESDWFECQLCGARTRDARSPQHKKDCPMNTSLAALRAAGEDVESPSQGARETAEKLA